MQTDETKVVPGAAPPGIDQSNPDGVLPREALSSHDDGGNSTRSANGHPVNGHPDGRDALVLPEAVREVLACRHDPALGDWLGDVEANLSPRNRDILAALTPEQVADAYAEFDAEALALRAEMRKVMERWHEPVQENPPQRTGLSLDLLALQRKEQGDPRSLQAIKSGIIGAPDDKLLRRPMFPFLSAADILANGTVPSWQARNWFLVNSLVCFFGDPAALKSWLAQGLALHTSVGRPFCGEPTRQGAVFVICGEGHHGVRRRLAGIAKYHGIDLTDAPLFVSSHAAALTDTEETTNVLVAVQALADATGQVPVLVLIDTVGRAFAGADENSTSDMARFVGNCDRIREAFSCAVLLVHHVGHGDKSRARGNSTLRGALDAEFRFDRNEDGSTTVTCTKMKDARMPPVRRFELVDVELGWFDEDGEAVDSAAVVACAGSAVVSANDTKDGGGKNQIVAMKVLRAEMELRRRNLLDGGFDPNTAMLPVDEWRDLCFKAGMERPRWYEVRNALEKTKKVRVENGFVTCSGVTL